MTISGTFKGNINGLPFFLYLIGQLKFMKKKKFFSLIKNGGVVISGRTEVCL